MFDGRYELIEQIGVGGMASVWRATDTSLGRDVAVKRLLPHLSSDMAASERFRREARSAAMLSHPGIVTVFDTGQASDGPYIVMELIEGQTVARKLAGDGPFDLPTVAALMKEAAAALDYAHAKGVVHRDIKPSNLIIESDGRVRLADFGIARIIDDTTTLTAEGSFLGTLAYVAPEVLQGEEVTPQADVYGLAAVAYEMLSGEPPFRNGAVGGLVGAIQKEPPPDLETVPPGVNAALSRALSKDPEDRPPTAGEFATSLLSDTTLPMAAVAPTRLVSPTGPPVAAPPASSQETTQVMSVPIAEEEAAKNRWWLWPAIVVVAISLIGILSALGGDEDPVVPVVAETTTSSATTTTTSTTSTTSTSTPTKSADDVAAEIRATLAALNPPDFKPKDVRRVEDRLDEILKEWEKNEPEKLKDKYEKAFESLQDLPESEQRAPLADQFTELATIMGIDVEDFSDGNAD